MKFDFFLSEMSVSNLHGGGITLQKVIAEDLDSIKYFAYVDRFAFDNPPNEKYAGRTIDLRSFWDQDKVRRVIGNTLASSIKKKTGAIKIFAKKAALVLSDKLGASDAIHGLICPQGMASVFALEELKRHRKVQYISWVMDDHIVQYVKKEWHYPSMFEKVFKKHLQEAQHVFVISKEMQEFYANRFGVQSTILFGPADYVEEKIKPIRDKTRPPQIGYFGAVATWQLDALQCAAKALGNTDTQLHIYSAVDKLPPELCVKGVELKGRIEPAKVLAAMRNYDAILLPIGFTEQLRNMSEFNIATKMSEYLAAGVPIIAVGPTYAAMIKYLKINQAAIVVESSEEADISQAFGLLNDRKLINQILINAKHLSVNETASISMRRRWSDKISRFQS